jgi:hypothetical protein
MRDLDMLNQEQEPIHQIQEDEEGHPIQTIPRLVMLDRAGMELEVLMWTGRTSTPKSVELGRQQIARNIQQGGYIPRTMCPLSSEFGGRPLVDAPPNEKACSTVNPATGCKHYQAELKKRRTAHEELEQKNAEQHISANQALLQMAKSLEKWSTRQELINTPDPDVPPSEARRPRG